MPAARRTPLAEDSRPDILPQVVHGLVRHLPGHLQLAEELRRVRVTPDNMEHRRPHVTRMEEGEGLRALQSQYMKASCQKKDDLDMKVEGSTGPRVSQALLEEQTASSCLPSNESSGA